MQDERDIEELERRIAFALERMGQAVARLPDRSAANATSVDTIIDGQADIARLTEALEAERARVVQLTGQVQGLEDREPAATDPLAAKVAMMTRQLDVQGLELQRMRKATVQLREQLRVLHESATEALVEPSQINKAMAAELDALRATRATEVAEMDEILAELEPLIEEARAHG